jgi:hypothetical protein
MARRKLTVDRHEDQVPRSSVRKINSWPEDADEKPADKDAHDQPEGAEWNPALANAMISGIPDDNGRQE